MRVRYIQTDIIWADPKANLESLEKIFSNLPDADLYVLPEMFTTGFATEPEGIAEENSVGLDWMKSMAARRNCALAGSISTKDGGRFYNRFYFVTPEGERHYDKHHLFTYSGEHLRYTAGNEKLAVEWRGVRFRLIVCYDLRFPAWIRNGGDNPYDVLLCVASWPTSRAEAWKTLIRARAIENQCFVVAVNREGTDPSCVYSGDSAIIDPWGNDVANGSELDMNALVQFRKKFPVLQDADKIELI